MRKKWLQVLIGVCAYLFVAHSIAKAGLSSIHDAFICLNTSWHILYLLVVIALMFVVWAIETEKWRIATFSFSKFSFLDCWRAVWYGLLIGQFTPNRIGEPLGRIAFVEAEHRGKALAVSIWCSFSQQLAVLLFGAFGLIVWLCGFGYDINRSILFIVVAFIMLWAAMLIFLFTRFKWILSKLEQWRFVRKFLSEELKFTINRLDATRIVLLSAFKYIIFSTQYVILLRIFGVEVNVFALYIAVSLNYLFITFVPSFAATELGVRLSAAVGFIGLLTPNVGGITIAATMLWLCNIAIPMLFAAWIKVKN